MSAYFDYNATAPTRPAVRAVVNEALREAGGNPSSMHRPGRRTRAAIEDARRRIRARLGGRRVIFTSGATEANNLALRGFARRHPEGCIVTTSIDHVSILATSETLAADGYRVERLAVDRCGRPDYGRIAELTRKRPCLVSTSWANGETGHVADVGALVAAVAERSLLHLDAAQAAGRLAISAGDGIDLLSISAHKLGGPMGAGALVIACDDARLAPVLTGGPHEYGLRAGTENVPGIVGMAKAVELGCDERERERERLAALRDHLWAEIKANVCDILRITPADGLFNTLTLAVAAPTADVLVTGLDLEGFAVSTGSACAAGASEPSHVIAGLGIEAPFRNGVVRMSMGYDTTADQVDRLARAFVAVVERARRAA